VRFGERLALAHRAVDGGPAGSRCAEDDTTDDEERHPDDTTDLLGAVVRTRCCNDDPYSGRQQRQPGAYVGQEGAFRGQAHPIVGFVWSLFSVAHCHSVSDRRGIALDPYFASLQEPKVEKGGARLKSGGGTRAGRQRESWRRDLTTVLSGVGWRAR